LRRLHYTQTGIPALDRRFFFSFYLQTHADLLQGFDLVGPENVLKPLIYYIEPLLRFRERQKELGLDIPFILHAGETLGDGTEADMNLYDAILLGTLRIGHGSVLSHFLGSRD
jgi:adenosine deaminase CECR1